MPVPLPPLIAVRALTKAAQRRALKSSLAEAEGV
jgi:hypothetical protein